MALNLYSLFQIPLENTCDNNKKKTTSSKQILFSMRSLLSSYFSRLKPIQDIATFDDEDGISDDEIAEHKTTKSKKRANQTENSCALKAQLDALNRLKYIDDSDSLDSAHNLIDESSDREEINRDFEKINLHTKSESLDEETNMQQLIDGRYGSNKEGKKQIYVYF